jgi:hypothetical protein
MVIFLTLFILISSRLAAGATCDTSTTIVNTWTTGQDGSFKFTVPISTSTWNLVITFDKPISSLSAWDGISKGCSGGTVCTYSNEVRFILVEFESHSQLATFNE